jgi:RND superfamily putative drug exporter
VITACGIILAGTFAALLVSPIRIMVQVGTAVAIGILIDTFIVRSLVVPAIATLIGRWNWWPSKLGSNNKNKTE